MVIFSEILAVYLLLNPGSQMSRTLTTSGDHSQAKSFVNSLLKNQALKTLARHLFGVSVVN